MHSDFHGIIIRKYPLTESSLIIHWMTLEHGRIKTVAKGARKTKNQFSGKLDLLNSGTLSIRHSRHSDLHSLSSFDLSHRPEQIASEVERLEFISYAIELLEIVSEIEIPHPELYHWFDTLLSWLDQKSPDAIILSQLELSLLKGLGLHPEPDLDILGEHLSKLLGEWMNGGKLRRSEVTPAQIRVLNQWTESLIRQELHKIPHSRPE
ncbi:MAG: DNA repair protein RecO [Verrucomicrobiota bacterium]|nr:DNA repair protein RecO [Verrucomicrobiota bacterium]